MKKEIVIRRLALLNFKGVRNLTIDFDENETSIYGANAAGKTTVFDAFMWLLFGKDSTGRSDGNRGFNIKTLGKNGTAIPRLPHEVVGWLDINGDEVVLKKTYSEIWSKKRGSAVDTFQGHQVECYYNDVPCSVTEYKRKVAEICDEQVFTLITNPAYFTSQSKKYQREMLFRLAGEVSDSEILASNPEFSELVNMLNGKTLEEFKREVSAKKRKIKDGIDGIPARIDEVKRNMPVEEDWEALRVEITSAEQRITELEAQVDDRSKAYTEAAKKKNELAHALSDVQRRISARKTELTGSLFEEYQEAKRKHETAVCNAERLRNDRRIKNISLPRLESELKQLNEQRERLIAEWRQIKSEVFSAPDPRAFVCPTCKRQLDADDVDAEIARLSSEFNRSHAERLEANKTIGTETKAKIDTKSAEIAKLKSDIFNIDNEIAQIENTSIYTDEPTRPNDDTILGRDKGLAELARQAAALKDEIEREVEAPDTSDLREQINLCRKSVTTNQLRLAGRERISASMRRVSELENEYRESQGELASLEGIEFKILQYSKARIEQIESRINGLFKIVRFKMFEQQINGGEVETCEATVDGVPFSDLNNACKVNAGLDIINAICTKEEIHAPIFIDNRESVTDVVSTGAQIINLVVSPECKTLKIL